MFMASKLPNSCSYWKNFSYISFYDCKSLSCFLSRAANFVRYVLVNPMASDWTTSDIWRVNAWSFTALYKSMVPFIDFSFNGFTIFFLFRWTLKSFENSFDWVLSCYWNVDSSFFGYFFAAVYFCRFTPPTNLSFTCFLCEWYSAVSFFRAARSHSRNWKRGMWSHGSILVRGKIITLSFSRI